MPLTWFVLSCQQFTHHCFCTCFLLFLQGKGRSYDLSLMEIVLISRSPWKGTEGHSGPHELCFGNFSFSVFGPFHSHKFWNVRLSLHIYIYTHTHTTMLSFSLKLYWIFRRIWENWQTVMHLLILHLLKSLIPSAILSSFYAEFLRIFLFFSRLSLDLFLGIWCFLMIL